MARRAHEKEDNLDDADDSVFSSDVSTYFQKTSRSPDIPANEKTREEANGDGPGVQI